jgi:AraC family transcriptional regulator
MEVGPGGARLFNVVFGARWATRLDERSGPGPSRPDAGALAWIAVRLRAEARSPDRDSEWMVEDLVGQMLDRCAFDSAPRMGALPPRWLADLETRVAADPGAAWTLARAAAIAGVHPVHVASSFRRFYRTTFGERLRHARVRTASRALVGEAAPLAEIALANGFSDQSHFTHVFKRYAGLTPGRYRALIRAGGRWPRH